MYFNGIMETYKASTIKPRWYQTSPLSRGILLGFLLTAIIPISFLGFKLYQVAWEKAWNDINEKHLLLAKSLTSPISLFVADQSSAMQVIGHNISEYLEGLTTENLIQHRLQDFVELSHGINSIIWLDPTGDIKAEAGASNRSPFKIDFANDQIFKNVIHTKKHSLYPLQRNIQTKENTILLAEPIIDHQGKLQGVLIAELGIEIFRSIRSIADFGINSYAFITDNTGQIVSHPKFDNNETIQYSSEKLLIKKIANGESGTREYFSKIENTDVIVAYTPVQSIGWGVFVLQPHSEVAHQVFNLIWSQ